MKIRKTLSIITLLFLIMLSSPIIKCYASAYINVPTYGSDKGGDDEKPTASIELEVNQNTTYTCNFEYSISGDHNTTIYGYNQQNKSIINGNIIPQENTLAGTAIGIKIEESTKISWAVHNIYVEKKEKKFSEKNCKKYICIDRPILFNAMGLKIPFLVISKHCNYVQCTEGTTGCKCNGGEPITITEKITSEEKLSECEEKAKEHVRKLIGTPGPSYEVRIMDSNDINANGNLTSLKSSGGCVIGSDSINCSYSYGIKTVCLNIKTSKVRYLNQGTCSNDEIEVKNDNDHWHYFTPLNSKSNSEFSIIMANKSESGLQKTNFCQSLIENNNNYLDFIRDKSNKKLTGNKNKDKQIVEAGCYLGVEIRIPISQEFYHEDDDYKFKGFNFYYKPIDTDNPFPNGLTNTSIWYKWNQSSEKNPNLTKSHSNINYIARSIDVNKVRNYTNDNPYTSWNNMYTNGVSKFIEETGVVTRLTNINSFYKLGCGPLNSDWSECKR